MLCCSFQQCSKLHCCTFSVSCPNCVSACELLTVVALSFRFCVNFASHRKTRLSAFLALPESQRVHWLFEKNQQISKSTCKPTEHSEKKNCISKKQELNNSIETNKRIAEQWIMGSKQKQNSQRSKFKLVSVELRRRRQTTNRNMCEVSRIQTRR